MSRCAPLVKQLAERLRGRNLKSLVYFHTDHFEPWRAIGAAAAVGPEIVQSFHDFCRATERIDFARRLTLFYKPHLNYALRRGDEPVRAHPDDLVCFLPRSDHEERTGREAMREIVTASAHDVQVHIHHEYYTATTAHTDPVAIEWFASPLGRSLDAARLELAIRLNRGIIARETGRDPTRWFFIHGHWALNASDDTSCTITNEIEILLRHGCAGDFTFPAGRQHTNPRIEVPYLCRPVDAAKGYDLPEAKPEIACGSSGTAASKFFIWASTANSLQCSIDYMSESSRRQLYNTEKAAGELIDRSYVGDGRLFIKTHGHSMHPYYFEHARTPVFLHQYPPTQTLLSVIFDAASEAGLDVQFLTVPEVYDLIVGASEKPEIDLKETYLRSTASIRRSPAAKRWPFGLGKRVAPADIKPVPRRAMTADAAEDLVRRTAIEILQQRIDSLGADGAGAYSHYSTMLEMGFPVPGYEQAALSIVRDHVPHLESYYEIGAGIGVLPFLLALNGYPAVGVEVDKKRHETSKAIWRSLSVRAGVDASLCRLIPGRFPESVKACDTAQAIAIVTNLISTQTPQQVTEILKGLRRYRYVLIDLERFCIDRPTPEARSQLLATLRGGGFEPQELPARDDYSFALLRNARVDNRMPSAPLWSRLTSSWRRDAAE